MKKTISMILKRSAAAVSILLCSIVFSGSLFREPELLDKDKKLIDLNKSIEFASRGGDSFTDSDLETEDDSLAETDKKPAKRDIVLIVSGKKITEYDGKEYDHNTMNFNDMVKRDIQNAEKVTFILVDDYADSKYYKQLKRFFQSDELHSMGVTIICKGIEELEND